MPAYVREDPETRDLLEKRIHNAQCAIVRQHEIKKLYDFAFVRGLMLGLIIAAIFAWMVSNGFQFAEGYGQP